MITHIHQYKTRDNLFQKLPITIVFLFFVLGSFAQKAELQIRLQQPNLQPATGTITIKGTDTTLIDNSFTGAATYILRDVTTKDEYRVDKDFMVYPNPVNTELSIDLPANRMPGVFEAYNLTGSLLMKAETTQGSFTLPAGNVIILLKYTDNDGMVSMNKLITNNNSVTVNILMTNGENNDGLKSAMASDDYEVSFSGQTENLDNANWNITVPTGTINTIDEIIAWSQKTLYWEMLDGNTNTTVTVSDIDENEQLDQATTTDGNIAERSIQKRFNNEKGLNMEYLLIAPYTDTAIVTVKQFMNDKLSIDTLRNGQFHLGVTGNGSDYLVKNKGVIIGNGLIGEETFFKLQGDIVSLELIVKGTGLKTDTSYFDMEKGLRTEDIQLEPVNYSKIINFDISSSEATKTIKSFRGYMLLNGDTVAVRNFTGNTGQLTHNSSNSSDQIEVGAIKIPAHEGVKQNKTLTGEHDFNKTATIVYQNSILPILIKGERGLAISNVSITGFGSAKTTGSNGKATLEMLLDKDKTDDNGLPFSNYETTLALASSAIINQNTDVNHVAGNNNEQEKTVKRNAYPYVVNESISSSNSSKTPLGFRGYIVFNTDTLKVANFTGVNGQLQFSNSSPTLNVKAGAKNAPYHSDATEKSLTLDGNDNVSFIVEADVNYFNVTGSVKEENTNDPISANVEAEGKEDDTNSNGEYAINNITQKRDANNKPRVYSFGVEATGDFETQNKNSTADGTNKVVNFVIPQATYAYWLFDNASSPNGATAKGWKDGELQINGTVNSGAYETNHTNKTSSTLTLDSLVFDATGFVKEALFNYVMSPGGTQQRFNLEEEQQENTYILDLILTEESGDNIPIGKKVNVREPDGDAQQKTITGKHTQITITGNYTGTADVKIWLNEDSEYDGLTGTINQSLKLPLESSWEDTLTVAINDVLARQTYVAFMKKATKTDLDIISIAEEGGNTEYNHLNAQGEREQNIYLVLETAQGTTTPADIQQFYNEAVAMHASKLTTDQGLQIMRMNYDEITSYTALPEGSFLLLTDNNAPTPGGVKIGNLPETFNRGYTILRTFDNDNVNIAANEFGEVNITLKDQWSTGHNINYYILDGNNVIQDVKKTPLRIALMYEGSTIPDPTQ